MNARKSRVGRKAARVEKSELDREFDQAFAVLREELNQALAAASAEHRAEVAAAVTKRTKARKAAYEAFEGERAKLLKRLMKTERIAA